MTRILLNIGWRLMISKRHRSVRQSLILLITNFFILSGVVFTVEIVFILLGIGNISFPLTRRSLEIISRIVF